MPAWLQLNNIWTEKFNALPYEIRNISDALELELRIKLLLVERKNIEYEYKKKLERINKNIEVLIVDYRKEFKIEEESKDEKQ